ncbi:phosphodiester glycosidase family protein [uncultured Alistipes sp.]|uniref:phosphodiester glycosidase family protein n=1 Tax=uncultured Alistipes sp. TaxID=538949 RepID=UPI00261261FA|nr:phosphodiester glycosidase family protein [uncultured Alistipes sp.]
MKKYLKLSFLALFLSAVALTSCKDDEEKGHPNPLVSAEVIGADADVSIDQEKKEITVVFYQYYDLGSIQMKFTLVEGAHMDTPYYNNTPTLDLGSNPAIVIMSGDKLIGYTINCVQDYGLIGLKASSEGVDADVKISHAPDAEGKGTVLVTFSDGIDLSAVNVQFQLGTGSSLVAPAGETTAVVDLKKLREITVKSERGGEKTYNVRTVVDLGFTVAGGFTEVSDEYDIPSYMKLYKKDEAGQPIFYVLVANHRAAFSVMSNGFDNLTTIPDFYAQDPKAMAIINGSATQNLAVVDGKIAVEDKLNQGKATLGIMEDGTFLFGDYTIADNGDVLIQGNPVKYALYGTQLTITAGAKGGDASADKNARASIGVTADNNVVFGVCQKYEASEGTTVSGMRDVMADFGCVNAIDLQAGSGACLYVGGQPTIASTKGPDFFKEIGCCAVLK